MYRSIGESIWKQSYVTTKFLLVVLLAGIASIVLVEVVLRYVLHAPLMGIEEILLFPAPWLYFLGAAVASQERTQIQAQALDFLLRKPKPLHIVQTIKTAISFVIAVWLTYWAYDFFVYSLHAGKTSSYFYLPLIFIECAVFVGFLLMTAYILVELADYIVKLSHELRTKVET